VKIKVSALVEHVRLLKPRGVIWSYQMNESVEVMLFFCK
jgi:hypothetical protein